MDTLSSAIRDEYGVPLAQATKVVSSCIKEVSKKLHLPESDIRQVIQSYYLPSVSAAQPTVPYTIVSGNLLDSREDYIAQQCNCITTKGLGLSKVIFDAYPAANDYLLRKTSKEHSVMGTIRVHDRTETGAPFTIINMMAQYYPGKPKPSYGTLDNTLARHKAFQMCLDQIAKIPGIKSIAMPYNIGCGYAGGRWKEDYEPMLASWCRTHPHLSLVLYKL